MERTRARGARVDRRARGTHYIARARARVYSVGRTATVVRARSLALCNRLMAPYRRERDGRGKSKASPQNPIFLPPPSLPPSSLGGVPALVSCSFLETLGISSSPRALSLSIARYCRRTALRRAKADARGFKRGIHNLLITGHAAASRCLFHLS
jgi:hypothetical protein